MGLFELTGFLLGVTFLLGYLNHRYLRLPQTIGLMLIAMILSLSVAVLGNHGFHPLGDFAGKILGKIDFNEALMIGMLGFLLFAGALNLNIDDLSEKKIEVAVFSVFSTVISMFIVGGLMHLVFRVLGLPVPFIYSLLFGALISPTDPVAALGILKEAQAPKTLETKIIGESLFNDGIGVVLFLGIYGAAVTGAQMSLKEFGWLFLNEALGGVALGLILGYLTYALLKKINDFQLEIIGTIALVMITYALSLRLHMSGPIAIVVAGLLIGNKGRRFAMSDETKEHLYSFWLLIDYILNALLFVLIGLEVAVVRFSFSYILAGLAAIAIVLLARYVSIALPVIAMKLFKRKFTQGVINIMTWGGLRGGISVALVMFLQRGVEKDILLTITYMVVAFSILVQGLTIKSFVKRQLEKPVLGGKLRELFG